ncbi:MAG: cobalamin-dependent protein [Desulfobacteraceae bacterium]
MMDSKISQLENSGTRPGQEIKIRVLLTKSRMDAHDRGIRYVARELSSAGMEVVFTRYALPEEIVKAAIQEGSDVIGVSCSTGGHLYAAAGIQDCLEKEGVKGIKVLFGGIIPDEDVVKMKERGVSAIFGPGSSIQEIIRVIKEKR